MIATANAPEWVRIAPIAYLVLWGIFTLGYIIRGFVKGKARKSKDKRGGTPKGGAL